MIPKVIFRYSSIHDEFLKYYLEMYYKIHKDPKGKDKLKDYPSKKKIERYIKKIEPLWKKDEKRILKIISKITGLKWQENILKVYLVGKCRPYSDPITIHPMTNSNDFIDVLTHEIIHQIQSQNSDIFKKWIKYMMKKYGDEKRKTKSHILLHAVHKKIYLALYDEKRLKRNLKRSYRKSYVRAWEIVEEEGYEEIIKKFRNVIKN